jgi:hypothetical protein
MTDITALLTTWNPDRVCFYPQSPYGHNVCGLPLFLGDFCAEHGEVGQFQEFFRAVMYAPAFSGDAANNALRLATLQLSICLHQYFSVIVPAALLYALLSGLGFNTTHKG